MQRDCFICCWNSLWLIRHFTDAIQLDERVSWNREDKTEQSEVVDRFYDHFIADDETNEKLHALSADTMWKNGKGRRREREQKENRTNQAKLAVALYDSQEKCQHWFYTQTKITRYLNGTWNEFPVSCIGQCTAMASPPPSILIYCVFHYFVIHLTFQLNDSGFAVAVDSTRCALAFLMSFTTYTDIYGRSNRPRANC